MGKYIIQTRQYETSVQRRYYTIAEAWLIGSVTAYGEDVASKGRVLICYDTG
jgi:hypothetical protein